MKKTEIANTIVIKMKRNFTIQLAKVVKNAKMVVKLVK